MMSAVVKAQIDLSALTHNVLRIKQLAPKSRILAMIKANGYGHGVKNVAQTLSLLVDGLGVARLSEAVMLHEAGIRTPIFIMDGFFSRDELDEAMKDHFIAVLNNETQINMIEKAQTSDSLKVWIKINTGMNRLGFAPEALPAIYKRLSNCPSILQPPGLMTHFACADLKAHPLNQAQIDCFDKTVAAYPGEKSLDNSAALLNFPNTHADWVRPGIMLYGASPIATQTGLELGLKPVMTLKSELIAINQVKAGDAVGYGSLYVCDKPTRIGVVAIGYGDGYPRHRQNGTPVLIHDRVAPIVGCVSMDMLTVDLNDHPESKIGDDVILWGKGLPAEVIAKQAETIAYELFCQVNQTQDRVEYIYTNSLL